jgi:class 3 adenylate cyclase
MGACVSRAAAVRPVEKNYLAKGREYVRNNTSSIDKRGTSMELAEDDFSRRQRFVPARIVQRYWEQAKTRAVSKNGDIGLADFLTSMEVQPWVESYTAAVIFADISGFSRLAEDLEKDLNCSVNAAEELYVYIESSMSQMVKTLYEHGGDIVKFAGDACMAVFDKECFHGSLPKATLSACKAAMDLSSFNFKANDTTIRVHCGVAAGDIVGYQVGGVMNRYEYIVTGRPIREMCLAADEAKAGQVVLSNSAYNNLWAAIPKQFRVDGGFEAKTSSLSKEKVSHSVKKGSLPVEAFRLESDNYILFRLSMETCSVSHRFLPPSPEDEISVMLIPILESYIPLPALLAIKSRSCSQIAGFKVCTILFIKLLGLEYGKGPEYLGTLQTLIRSIQSILTANDGTLCRFTMDDKGSYLLAAFGLSSSLCHHQTDRAVSGAIKIKETVTDYSFASQIGLTTGKVFCGTVGGSIRHEYTMHGQIVNLAARFMSIAQKNEILVCSHTRNLTIDTIAYSGAKQVYVKGASHPISVFSPKNLSNCATEWTYSGDLNNAPTTPIIGRLSALSQCELIITNFIYDQENGIVAVEGDHGMGKTRLCHFLLRSLEPYSMKAFYLCGQQSTIDPYGPWRRIIVEMLGITAKRYNEYDISKAISEHIKSISSSDKELLCKLLDPDAPLGITNKIGNSRAEMGDVQNIQNVLAMVFERLVTSHAIDAKYIVIAFDNVHLMDKCVLDVLKVVVDKHQNCIGVITYVPPQNEETSTIDTIQAEGLRIDCVASIPLPPLNIKDVVNLTKFMLSVKFVEAKLVEEIYLRSNGNPLFTSEILTMMKTNGLIVIGSDHRARLNVGMDKKEQVIPDAMETLVRSKLGMISNEIKRTHAERVMQVASVFGMEFSKSSLTAIIRSSKIGRLDDGKGSNLNTVEDVLRALENVKLIKRSYTEMDKCECSGILVTYAFTQSYIQAVAYGSLLFEERKQIHQQIAAILEENAGQHTASLTVTKQLAFHYFKGCNVSKAIHYLEESGYRLRLRHEYRAVKLCYVRLLQMCGHMFSSKHFPHKSIYRHQNLICHDAVVKRWRYANWCMRLADTYVLEYNDKQALAYYMEALASLKAPTNVGFFDHLHTSSIRKAHAKSLSITETKIICLCYLAICRLDNTLGLKKRCFFHLFAIYLAKRVRSDQETMSLISTCYVDYAWCLFCTGNSKYTKESAVIFQNTIPLISKVRDNFSIIYLHYRLSEVLLTSGDLLNGQKYLTAASKMCHSQNFERLNFSILRLGYRAQFLMKMSDPILKSLELLFHTDDNYVLFLDMFYAMDCGKMQYCRERFFTLLSTQSFSKISTRALNPRIRRSSITKKSICPKPGAAVKPLNTINPDLFFVDNLVRSISFDFAALKSQFVCLLDSHTHSVGSLESMVVIGMFSCAHGWYDVAIEACRLSFDLVQSHSRRNGPLNWYYPFAQIFSIYCAIQHFHSKSPIRYGIPIQQKKVKRLLSTMKRFKFLSRPFKLIWNYVLGWHYFATHNMRSAILSWKRARALAKEEQNGLLEFRTRYLTEISEISLDKCYLKPSNVQELVCKLYQTDC